MIRTLQPSQRCEIWVASVETGLRELVYATGDALLEAPNWTLDDAALIVNGAGVLWRLDLDSRSLDALPLSGLPALNNDHVLGPNGKHIFLSANDGHLYRADLRGGEATRITADDGLFHFLHGVSPDGRELAYVGIEAGDLARPGRLMTMPANGGPSTSIEAGPGHVDGPEYSPDGEWLYFNTEAFTGKPGHAQIARVRADGIFDGTPDGTGRASFSERLVESETVDWFPHISPDGRFASYLRYPPGTVGHPADLPVDVVVVSTSDWTTPLRIWPLFGGQGTINVNSWSPDSTRLAYVAYPASSAD